MPVLSDAQIATVMRNAGFPGNEIGTGVAVALAESGGNSDAVSPPNRNGTKDWGLFQINDVHKARPGFANRMDPQTNANLAFAIWKDAGNKWTPWSTFNSGRYLAFKARGAIAAGAASSAVPTSTGSAPATATAAASSTIPSDLTLGGFWLRAGVFLLGGILLIAGFAALAGISGNNIAVKVLSQGREIVRNVT